VRFEAVFKGKYAHDITTQLLRDVHSDMELQRLIAKHITDKYRFYDSHTEDVTSFTNALLGIAVKSTVDALTRPSSRDNSLKQSIDYLKKNSGLFSVLYKVFNIWGNSAEEDLLEYLYKAYKADYKPEAHISRDIRIWLKNHKKELSQQKLEDSL